MDVSILAWEEGIMAMIVQPSEVAFVDLSDLACLVSLLPDGPIDIGPDATAVLTCC